MIDNCPKCDYALAGLPDQYRCPECGIDYDREAVAFWDRRRLAMAVLILNALLALFLGFFGWLNGNHSTIGTAAIIFFCASFIALLYWRKLGTDGVYISPRLIQIVRRGTVQQVNTQDVSTVRWSFVNGRVYVYNLNGIEVLSIATGSSFRAHKIAAQIRAFTSECKL